MWSCVQGFKKVGWNELNFGKIILKYSKKLNLLKLEKKQWSQSQT